MNPHTLQQLRRSLAGFLSQSQIQLEQGGVGPFHLSPTQRAVLPHLTASPPGLGGPWLIINKPRQAHISTLCAGWLLREIELTRGANGILISNKDETNQVLWDRLRQMLDSQPACIREPSTVESAKQIQFGHYGVLKTITAKGDSPGLGMGIDRLVASEYGFWQNAQAILSKILPALIKRPQARVIIESTPGLHGCAYHQLWLQALRGKNRFTPVFLNWMDYESYTSNTPITLDQSELAYINRYPNATARHMAFRRMVVETVCSGDVNLFDHYYPPDPYTGWLTSLTPALPQEPLKAQLETSREDPEFGQGWAPPCDGKHYLILADPNGYGQAGDPSAYCVMEQETCTEVAAWSGRKDPRDFGHALAEMGRTWNNATIVLESNSAAAITALYNTGYPHVWNDGGDAHPGYYRTGAARERAQIALVERLHTGSIRFQSKGTLHQLLTWDGKQRRSSSQDAHHFDRAICAFMAADMLDRLGVPRTPSPVYTPGYLQAPPRKRVESTPRW